LKLLLGLYNVKHAGVSFFLALGPKMDFTEGFEQVWCLRSSLKKMGDGNAGPSTPLKNASLRMTACTESLRMTASLGVSG
jgi:hypothetical protein